MQLFHIEPNKIHVKGDNIEVFSVPELISQLRKVLRIQKGDKICIQYSDNKGTTRYEISINDWTDKEFSGEIVSTQTFSFPEGNISMLIAMPNKREKAELIVQKLTEIGVQNICFWVSEHSIIRQWNDKKAERLYKISHEAIEQSRGILLPKIKFLSPNELNKFITGKSLFLANQGGLSYKVIKSEGKDFCGIIGPEGGFSNNDLLTFKKANIIDLGTNVLRMETASIILAWLLKNI